MKNKGKLYSISLASIALVFVFSILISSVASAAQVTRIGSGSDPAVHGSKVVWANDGVIHVYDLTARTDTTVSSSAASYPAIYGNKLVWHDESSGTSRLTVYDIPSGARSYITRDIDSGSIPAIYGNRIVWSANSSVYMRDISTSTQTKIASGEGPDIYDTRITYSYDDGDMPRIYVYDVITRETITASPYSGHLSQPHIYGNKVIWSNFYTRLGHISMYDVATNKTIDVTSESVYSGDPDNPDAGDDTGTHTDINGDKIAYAKLGTDQFGSAGVHVYNISTGKSTQVANYENGVLTTPDVHGNTVVWGIKGNYGDGGVNNGIYMSDLSATDFLPPVASFTANVTSGPAPLVVLFTDTGTGGIPTSWHWDTGDGVYSKHAMNATHTFTKPGNYTVSLTVENAAGNDTLTKPNYIVVTDPKAPTTNDTENLTETRITTNEFDQQVPAIHGDKIVWIDSRNDDEDQNYDVYMYNLSTSEEIQITTNKSWQRYPAIYNNRIVWVDNRSGNWDIYMKDLSTSKEIQITANNSNQYSPEIFGDRIVWYDERNGKVNIYMYNLSTFRETQITNNGVPYSPAIYGDKIVWQDNRGYSDTAKTDIYMYDLSTSRETRITTNGSAENPAIYGDRIVWQDSRNGNADIYMRNLTTSKETRITTNASYQISPSIYDNRIVWQDGRNKNDDIYMYDLSTSRETRITSNKSDQSSPAIYGDRIVWQDGRNGKDDIYMCTISGENPKPVVPVADFSTSTTSGYAPLSVQFTDISQNATSRLWDFNNDGQAESNDVNPVYIYTASGTYTVNLTVSNKNGTDSKTTAINVLPGSSSRRSSGGSGGAGGSPEPVKNVQVKEISQAFITNGKPVQFDFTKNVTCVVYVKFDAKKTLGKTTTTAEMLKGKSSLVSELPSGEVYKSFNVWIGNGVATSKNIENPVICFKVEKFWIKDKMVDPTSITLNIYSDEKWEQLPVKMSGEDDKFLYFTAETSRFSSFAITGKANNRSQESVAETQLETENGTVNKNYTLNKESKTEQGGISSIPGFEAVCVVAGLLAVFLYKRK